jgi:hypothetical protein
MTGEWPPGEIDHINGNRADNRWCNLRLATRGQNQHNRPSARPNKTGFRGVGTNGNGFCAHISINGKLIHFPTRATAEEAYAKAVFSLMCGLPELFIAVNDELAKRGVLTKANFKKLLSLALKPE